MVARVETRITEPGDGRGRPEHGKSRKVIAIKVLCSVYFPLASLRIGEYGEGEGVEALLNCYSSL
jgi:hypothetical protein